MSKSALIALTLLALGCTSNRTPPDTTAPQAAACPLAQENYPFVVKVRDFYGVEGYGFDYYLTGSSLTVVRWDDVGSLPKEVHSRALNLDESSRLNSFLLGLPIESLEPDYIDSAVDDGLQLWFEFRLPSRLQRTVVLKNTHQEDLFGLCDEINRLLPDPLHIRQSRGGVRIGHSRSRGERCVLVAQCTEQCPPQVISMVARYDQMMDDCEERRLVGEARSNKALKLTVHFADAQRPAA